MIRIINKAEITEQERLDIIRLYTIDKIGYKKIAKLLGIQKRKVRQLLVNNNVNIKEPPSIIVPSKQVEDTAIKMYLENRMCEREVGEELNIGLSRARKILNKYNIKRRGPMGKWELDTKQVLEMYRNGMSIEQIRKHFGTSKEPVMRRLEENNIEIRDKHFYSQIYDINQDYFEKIDSPEKAYWLGWLFSDGCNQENVNYISFHIHSNDYKIIENFKKSIQSSHPIVYSKTSKSVGINISNKKMSHDLAKLGCVQAKSLILEWPKNLLDEYIPFFIRGYFEGDGSIWSTKKKKNGYVTYGIEIVSSEMFIFKLHQIIKEYLGVDFKYRYHKNMKNLRLECSNYDKIIKFMSWIYKDCHNIILDRKYERFQKMLYYKGKIFTKMY